MPSRPENSAAVVLAAGRSTRMGECNKLLMEVEPGVAMVRRVVERALASGVRRVFVVTGHEADRVVGALRGLDCEFVHNAAFADGMSGSVKAGFRRCTEAGASGVLVLLADMPFITTGTIGKVLAAAADHPGRIVQPVTGGRPAHPVWLPAAAAPLVERIGGDQGVRSLVEQTGAASVTLELPSDAALDLDTPEDFSEAIGRDPDARDST